MRLENFTGGRDSSQREITAKTDKGWFDWNICLETTERETVLVGKTLSDWEGLED